MYGWLTSLKEKDGIQIRCFLPDWIIDGTDEELIKASKRSAEETSQRLQRFHRLTQFDDRARQQLMFDPTPMALVMLVKDDLLEYAALMFAAHARLPAQRRSQRENRVKLAFAQFVGPEANSWPTWPKIWMGLANILPDASIESVVGSWMGPHLMKLASHPDGLAELPPSIRTLIKCLNRQNWLTKNEDTKRILAMLLVSRTYTQREQWVDILRNLNYARPDGLELAIAHYRNKVANRELTMSLWHGLNALAEVLKSIDPAAPVKEWEQRIQAELELADAAEIAENTQICLSSMAAVDAGINLGPNTASSRQAMEEFNQFCQCKFDLTDEAAYRLIRHTALPAHNPDIGPAEGVIDKASLQSWSIDQLAAWIEGPLPSEAGPTDRQHIVEQARLRRRRAQDTASASPTPRPPAPTEPDELSPEEVDQLIHSALANTARYFMGEIGDLRTMAKQMALPDELKARTNDTCSRQTDSLETIEKMPGQLSEQEARSLLHEAERVINQLRLDIAKASRLIDLDHNFTSALSSALRQEPLSLGKQTGGVIKCAVAFDQWGAICERFHHRWLSTARDVLINGEAMSLQADQALVLYVTGSSQSGYAFDVSVHLWRRRPNRNSPPSQATGLYPPMNTNDWFDTYQTCCVLHVPHARQN